MTIVYPTNMIHINAHDTFIQIIVKYSFNGKGILIETNTTSI